MTIGSLKDWWSVIRALRLLLVHYLVKLAWKVCPKDAVATVAWFKKNTDYT